MSNAEDMPIRKTNRESNKLWIARKMRGLPQKWVAKLLGHHSLSVVSEYERGVQLPTLPVALKLQAIYGKPITDLFPELYQRVSGEVAAIKTKHPYVFQLESQCGVGETAPPPELKN